MSIFGADTGSYFNIPYYDYLDLSVRDYGEQKLEAKKEEIEQRKSQKMMTAADKPSNLLYILLGVGAVAILTLAVLKKKGVI